MKSALKERLPQLDLFRAIAILGVIHVHATSVAAGGQAMNSPYYVFINWVNIFFKFGTPCFIFLSSFVLFYNYMNRPAGRQLVSKFYKRRLLYIIIPYLVASCCYYALNTYLYGDWELSFLQHVKAVGIGILTGSAYTHLYFVFINMQFYLLFPLLLLLFQKNQRLANWTLPLGLIIQWSFVLWNKYGLQLVNKASYAPSYMAYYMMGVFLAVNYGKLEAWLNRSWRDQTRAKRWAMIALWFSWLSAAMVHVQLYYAGRTQGAWVNSLWYELLWNLHTMLSALVIMHASFWLYRKGSRIGVSGLTRIGALSFAIYLLHPVFLMFYRRFRYNLSPESLLYVLWTYGAVPVSLLLSAGLAAVVFRRLPGSELLLGSKPEYLRGRVQPALAVQETSESPAAGA